MEKLKTKWTIQLLTETNIRTKQIQIEIKVGLHCRVHAILQLSHIPHVLADAVTYKEFIKFEEEESKATYLQEDLYLNGCRAIA